MSKPIDGADNSLLVVDPEPKFELSPYLFMQFMEPLGTVDGSVEAGWDFEHDCWREDLIEVTRELAPTLLRWPGGILSSFYRWKEGIGPRPQRTPLFNKFCRGIETNQVGTHEFIDFCRLVGAAPLIAVNFEADGKRIWSHPAKGGVRAAGPEEAAGWVAYCNEPSNAARIENRAQEPLDVRLWQIGNETSYGEDGFDCETAAARTLAFALAMRQADPHIALIGWGDSGWAPTLLEVTGGALQYVAFHHHFDSGLDDSPLHWSDFRRDPANTWRHLMHACKSTESKIQEMRLAVAGHNVSLALTESHFGLGGRNRSDVLATWAAGVAEARVLNVHARNGDLLKIATLADFCGTRLMSNAVMIPPFEKPYMMPVARVMALYRNHSGERALGVTATPEGLDVTASRTEDQVFLHVVNTNRVQAIRVDLKMEGATVLSGRAFEIVADPMFEVDQRDPGILAPVERPLTSGPTWQFPAASVTALELQVREGAT